MAIILNGKELSKKVKLRVKREVEKIKGRKPGLAVILVGEEPASKIYVKNKIKSCREVGIRSFPYFLPQNVKTYELLELIGELNASEEVDGILVQLPLPEHIDKEEVINSISPQKDVDGFHPCNMGKLLGGGEGFVPCTPLGIKLLLDYYRISLKGKDVVVVGAGFIVGRPLLALLLREGATVSVCHIHTKDLKKYTKEAEVLISATGVPHLIKEDMVREGAIVIDVGIRKVGDRIVGDVDFERVKEKARAITPVPGGVGPMTVSALLLNTLKAYGINLELKELWHT